MDVNGAVRSALANVGGEFFFVKFRKANGEIRNMHCRLKVRKHLKGGEKKGDDIAQGNITVYDMQAKGYRRFKTENVLEIRHGGKVLKFS